MARAPAFKVKQLPDGKWDCSAPRRLQGVSCIGDTADEAIRGMEITLEDFEEFKRHVRGRCGEGCRRCASGESGTYGLIGSRKA